MTDENLRPEAGNREQRTVEIGSLKVTVDATGYDRAERLLADAASQFEGAPKLDPELLRRLDVGLAMVRRLQ